DGAAAQQGYCGVVGEPPQATKVRAAPFVRKLARDLGVPLEQLKGSGPQGRVRASDVEAMAQPSAEQERVPLRGMRREIADHMVRAMREAPQVTSMDLLDA